MKIFFIYFVSIRQRKKSIERTQAIILKIHSVQLKNKDFTKTKYSIYQLN